MNNPYPVAPELIKSYASSALIMNEKNEVLLMLRDDLPLWVNIGGNNDPGEDFETAMHREVLEETGCTVKILRLAGDFFSPVGPDHYRHERIFLCHLNDNQMPLIQDEGTALGWFSQETMPINMAPRFRKRIMYAFSNDANSAWEITDQLALKGFMQSVKSLDGFVGLDDWLYHPKVVEKRANGQLAFDPLPLLLKD